MREYTCKLCGKKFYRDREGYIYKFCSLSCSTSYKNSHPKNIRKTIVRCNNCDKEVLVKNCRLKTNKNIYCSRKCYLDKVKVEIDDIYCDNCGELIDKPAYRLKRGKHHFCNKECFHQWNWGEHHPRWVGGYSSKYGRGWKVKRELTLERDCKCKHCGTKEKLEVHHIVPYSVSKNNSLENLITLCKSCHPTIGSLYWNKDIRENYFNYINSIK